MTADGRTIQRFLVMTLVAVLLALVLLFAVIADLHAQEPSEIKLNALDEGQRFELAEGQELIIELEGNPSTGYTWEVQRADGRILRQIGETEFQPESQLLGAPGKQAIRFEAVGAGQTDLELVYHRPWETHVAPLGTFSVQVEGVGRFVGLRRSMYDIETEASGPIQTSFTELSSLPPSFSWAPTYTTPIRDQGLCGSCWAFACVGMLESNIKIKDNLTRDLSEQYLLSCNPYNFSCSGGNFHAHDMHEFYVPPGDTDAGAVNEVSFTYVGTDTAPCMTPYTNHETIFSWDYVSWAMPTTAQIKQAILDYGPIGCGIRSGYSAFWNYPGGVFETHNSGDPDHAVVLVGWDDNQGTSGVWILRNSWGTSWGESGYMRIGYGVSSVGTAANYIVYLPGSFPNTVSLPLVASRYNRFPSPTWSNIMTEDFEGTFPGPGWVVLDNNGPTGGECWWGRDDHRPRHGMYSAWPARSGANGVDPAAADYPEQLDSWMIYGPFSLVGAMDAELLFDYWFKLDAVHPYDIVAWMASIDGHNFYGDGYTGDSSGWQSGNFDLTDVWTLGDLRGQSQVWVAFECVSNNDGQVDDGPFIDNIRLRTEALRSGPSATTQEEEPSTTLPDTVIKWNIAASIDN